MRKGNLPPLAPPKIGGELDELTGPLLIKEGVGGGGDFPSGINNKPQLKSARKELRNESSPAEKKLWCALQYSRLDGYKFRRQHSVGFFILDFYCPSQRLAIEVDGDSHFTDDAIHMMRREQLFSMPSISGCSDS